MTVFEWIQRGFNYGHGKMADKEKQHIKTTDVVALPHDAQARREQLLKAQETWVQGSLQKSDDTVNSEDK